MSASRLMSAAVLGTSRATPRGSCGRMAGGLTSTAARRRASSRAPSRILLHASAGTSVDFDSGATKASGEGSDEVETSALSIIDSTDDVFQEFCDAQVELVGRALGRGARCMLYLRSVSADGDSLQLAEVASFPRSSRSSSGNDGAGPAGAWEVGGALRESDDFGAAATSFVELAGNEASTSGRGSSGSPRGSGTGGPGQAITLSGSIDDSDGQSTAAEALLVKQRVFALPSANALVVPLSRDDTLVGLLVGEMPQGRVSSRVRKERVKAASGGDVEVEVLSAASAHTGEGEEKDKEAAADTAAQFGDRRQAALTAAAKSIVAAWAMHRRANYATAAAVQQDRRVAGFTYAAKEPLTVLRTLGGMLSSHLKPDTPSRDMADAIVAQGDVLASLSEALESALYPRDVIEELTAGAVGPEGERASQGPRSLPAAAAAAAATRRQLPSPDAAAREKEETFVSSEEETLVSRGGATVDGSTATSKAIALGETPTCDLTPIVAGLLASGEVIAAPSGVTMTATFPPPPLRAVAAVDPRDARELLALVIDAALVAAPRGAEVDVVVSANGGSRGGVAIAASVRSSQSGSGLAATTGSRSAVDVPAGALVKAAGGGGGALEAASYVGAGTSSASPSEWGSLKETQSLKIARSLVEGAGGIFHVLPALPPMVGRIELWLPAAEVEPTRNEAAEEEEEDDAVDV